MPCFLDVCEKRRGEISAISSKASCREAIEDTKTSEPRYDLQMARILAEAREKAQQEVGRNKSLQFAALVEGKGSVYKMIEHGLGLGSINDSSTRYNYNAYITIIY